MPGIEAAYEKYKKKGFIILGINFTNQDNLPDVQAFVEEFKLTFPILLDQAGEVSADLYGMRGLPTSYFIDSNGILRRIQVGPMLPEVLDRYLAEIFGQ
jgi:peroxiredoxin